MKKRRHSVLADLSFQGILILVFIAVVFLAFRHENLAVNGIILCIAVLMFIFTYFTSVRTGLIADIVFIFLLVSYVVLQSINEGTKVSIDTYFWIFWPMGMIIAISGYVRQYQLLDRENEELARRAERFITIDELTQMNNLLGFQRDAGVYMNMSRRYHLTLELVLWRLAYEENLEQLLGREDMKTAISIISDAIKSSLRKEDLVYLLEKEPYIWGTLMFSKPEAAEIVISHVRDGVGKVALEQLVSHKNYSLEIEGTVVPYDGSMISPLTYLNMAKDQLWRGGESGLRNSGSGRSAGGTKRIVKIGKAVKGRTALEKSVRSKTAAAAVEERNADQEQKPAVALEKASGAGKTEEWKADRTREAAAAREEAIEAGKAEERKTDKTREADVTWEEAIEAETAEERKTDKTREADVTWEAVLEAGKAEGWDMDTEPEPAEEWKEIIDLGKIVEQIPVTEPGPDIISEMDIDLKQSVELEPEKDLRKTGEQRSVIAFELAEELEEVIDLGKTESRKPVIEADKAKAPEAVIRPEKAEGQKPSREAVKDEKRELVVRPGKAAERKKVLEAGKAAERKKVLEAGKAVEWEKALEAGRAVERKEALEAGEPAEWKEALDAGRAMVWEEILETVKEVEGRKELVGEAAMPVKINDASRAAAVKADRRTSAGSRKKESRMSWGFAAARFMKEKENLPSGKRSDKK